MKIQFLGAAREVTGSKHLITTEHGKKILLDCGAFQGKGLETDQMNRETGIAPEDLDHIILTHAHIDHSGLIPYFYKKGFRGSVICTHATRDLCAIMLSDSGFIQEHDTQWFNKKRAKKGLPPVEPLYTQQDAAKCMELFIGVAHNRKFYIDNNVRVKFTNSGHMLGSAVATIELDEKGSMTRIGYTGDIGRPNNYLLRTPDPFPQCDYLITESTYGDRLHQEKKGAEEELLRIVKYTCVEKKGKLIIPSFAIGRTQEVVYLLNNFYNEGRLPRIPIYVDSPLAVNATEIFRMHTDQFNSDVQKVMETDSDPFGFGTLKYIKDVNESKKLNFSKEPCVIISASGMMEAGRIKHHLANNIDKPQNTVLAVGYCAPRTLGARILSGEKDISIFGKAHHIKADIFKIDALSGHGDYKEMMDYLECQDKTKLKKVFLVHGEEEAQIVYKTHLKKSGFKHIALPERGEEFEL
ncbi:MAG: MBL fold metallo-hydrolase [Bacteroidetes bacterium]|nr:MBL fold metallo-hydrolase [Bacteroidota bacterium]MBU1581080.1 MBL fold metallo-hydrolase [Bacteroidota bacterium]MBU2557627.1 MBL fold metallo-hydrolase [Bacteroidota bacterium]